MWADEEIEIGLMAKMLGRAEVGRERKTFDGGEGDTDGFERVGDAAKFFEHVGGAMAICGETCFERVAKIVWQSVGGVVLLQVVEEIKRQAALVEPAEQFAMLCVGRVAQGIEA